MNEKIRLKVVRNRKQKVGQVLVLTVHAHQIMIKKRKAKFIATLFKKELI